MAPPIFNNTTQPNNLYPVANGTTSSSVFVDYFSTRDPTPQDVNFQIQKKWLNTTDGGLWILQNFVSLPGQIQANWIPIGSSSITETLTGNSGGAVHPDAFQNINVIGDGTTIDIVGDPLTNTLTVSATTTVATSYDGNTGTAMPAANTLNIVGTGIISTTAAGDTVTISSTGGAAVTYDADSGSATPAGNILNIIGGTGVTTNGAGNTITITSTNPVVANFSVVAQTFTFSRTYTPTANMVYCTIQCCGAGAGGGGCTGDVTQFSAGGGGQSGAYSQGVFSAAAIGASQAVTVGLGGTGGAPGANAGLSGGNTSVGALISANGGSGGSGGTAALAGFIFGGSGVNAGTGGDFNTSGMPGGNAIWLTETGVGAFVQPGSGGSSFYGGGALGVQSNANGNNATSYGGGGSGACQVNNATSFAGGNGFDGIVYITEYVFV